MEIIPLITAFGLGSIFTTIIQTWLSKQSKIETRNYEERKAAYVGLLEAYHRAAVEGTDEASKEFALWQMRCELVAPKPVRAAIEEIVSTNNDMKARYKAHEELKNQLRLDLGVAK